MWDNRVDERKNPISCQRENVLTSCKIGSPSREDRSRDVVPYQPKLSSMPGVKRQDTLAREGIKPSRPSSKSSNPISLKRSSAKDCVRFGDTNRTLLGWSEVSGGVVEWVFEAYTISLILQMIPPLCVYMNRNCGRKKRLA